MNFLEGYINYISELGAKISVSEWWYTSLSTKNRFQSPMLSYYEKLQGKNNTLEVPAARNLLFILKAMVGEGVKVLHAFLFGIMLRRKLFQSQDEFLILKSFAYPGNYSDSAFQDSYWGQLPHFLVSEKVKVLQLVKPLGCQIKAMSFAQNNAVIPVHVFLTPWSYLKCLLRFFRSGLDWRSSDPVVSALLRREFFNDSFLYALMLEEVGRALSSKLRIRKVLLPFEGNAWERGLVSGVRRSSTQIKIVGYVHTVIPEISANLFPGKGEFERGPFPDEILTFGEVATQLLNTKGHYPKGVLKTSCALRFESLLKRSPLPANNKQEVVILLEGVLPAAQIVDFILREAPKNSDWKFVFRFHPALPWEKMRPFTRNGSLPIPGNVTFSEGKSLYQDIESSGVVVYWGSTAGIEALYLGRPVIHVDLGTRLSYDPLFMHEGFHWKVGLDSDLAPLLKRLNSLNEEEKNKLCCDSQNFLKSYFAEITPERMRMFR